MFKCWTVVDSSYMMFIINVLTLERVDIEVAAVSLGFFWTWNSFYESPHLFDWL